VVAKVVKRLSVCKRAVQKFEMERFNLKNLSSVEVKNHMRLKSQIGYQLWKTLMMIWASVGLGIVLQRI
jgi:hypothetical protein